MNNKIRTFLLLVIVVLLSLSKNQLVYSAVVAGDACNDEVDIYTCNGRNFYICSQNRWLLQNVCATDCLGIPSFANNCNRNSLVTLIEDVESTTASRSSYVVTETSVSETTNEVGKPTNAKYIYGPILGAFGLMLLIFGGLFIYRYYRLHGLEKKLVIVEGPGGIRIIVDPDYQDKDTPESAKDEKTQGTLFKTSTTTNEDKKVKKNKNDLVARKAGVVAIPGFAGRSSTQKEISSNIGRTTTIKSTLSSIGFIPSSPSANGSTQGTDGIPQTRGVNTAAVFPEDEVDNNEAVTNIADVLEQEYIVVYEYKASAEDEIDLNFNDIVRIDLLFNDGWAQGINVTTERSGLLPCSCLVVNKAEEHSVLLSPVSPNITENKNRKDGSPRRRYSDYGLVGYTKDNKLKKKIEIKPSFDDQSVISDNVSDMSSKESLHDGKSKKSNSGSISSGNISNDAISSPSITSPKESNI